MKYKNILCDICLKKVRKQEAGRIKEYRHKLKKLKIRKLSDQESGKIEIKKVGKKIIKK
jgi:hypothetical protein